MLIEDKIQVILVQSFVPGKSFTGFLQEIDETQIKIYVDKKYSHDFTIYKPKPCYISVIKDRKTIYNFITEHLISVQNQNENTLLTFSFLYYSDDIEKNRIQDFMAQLKS